MAVDFDGGFDTGDLSQWDINFQEVEGRFSAVTSDAGVTPKDGSHMGRVEVRSGDDPISTGGNICMVIRDDSIAGHYDQLGDEHYTGFSAYFPAGYDFVPNDIFNYFFEWHGDNNFMASLVIGIDDTNPTTTFLLENRRGSGASPTIDYYPLPDYEEDRWIDFVVRAKWGNSSDGIIQCWVDGVLIVDESGINNWFTSGQTSVKPQFGMYRNAYAGTSVFYLDAFKIGTTYADVDPSGSQSAAQPQQYGFRFHS